ncbi:MAG: hypothetical protein ICV64_03020 [Thermoleophilia bacterium]|nr:hypothetical protein [Thermoleophilia bacterium]
MRIGSTLALLGLVLTAAGCGGNEGGNDGAVAAGEPTARLELNGQLFGFVWPPGGVGELELAKLDPQTLAPRSQRLTLSAQGAVTELSPDANKLAIATHDPPSIAFVHLQSMRLLGDVDLGVPGYVSRLAWARSGTLFAAVGQSTIALIDPEARQVLETRQVDGSLLGDIQPIAGGALALVAPTEGIGPLKAVVFGEKGTSSQELGGIVGGSTTKQGDDEADFRATENIPALAVDPDGQRALVVPAGDEVAEIDLASMRVTFHSLSRPVSLLERLHNWLEPKAQAKLIEGPVRHAIWLRSGLVAVSGADHTISNDQREVVMDPAGLSLIDTRSWSVRAINEGIDGVRLSADYLVASEPWCAGSRQSYGLVAYGLNGNEFARICRDEGFDAQLIGKYGFLGFDDNTKFEVVELETGKTVARPRTAKTTSLITN